MQHSSALTLKNMSSSRPDVVRTRQAYRLAILCDESLIFCRPPTLTWFQTPSQTFAGMNASIVIPALRKRSRAGGQPCRRVTVPPPECPLPHPQALPRSIRLFSLSTMRQLGQGFLCGLDGRGLRWSNWCSIPLALNAWDWRFGPLVSRSDVGRQT